MRRRLALAPVAVCVALGVAAFACGDFSANVESLDAASSETSVALDAGDAGDAGPPCTWNAPFRSIALLENVNGATRDTTPRLSPDERTLTFDRTTTGDQIDLFVAHRPSRAVPFGAPVAIKELNTEADDAHPALSPDQLSIIFARGRQPDGGPLFDLFFAARPSLDAPFAAPIALAWANTGSNEIEPYVTHDGKEVYFASDRGGSTEHDIYVAPAQFAATSSALPVLLTDLSSQYDELAPVVSADGLTVYFQSNRPSTVKTGVWAAHRASRGAAFGTPELLGDVSSGTEDIPGWISADECRLYFSSARSGIYDIYLAERVP